MEIFTFAVSLSKRPETHANHSNSPSPLGTVMSARRTDSALLPYHSCIEYTPNHSGPSTANQGIKTLKLTAPSTICSNNCQSHIPSNRSNLQLAVVLLLSLCQTALAGGAKDAAPEPAKQKNEKKPQSSRRQTQSRRRDRATGQSTSSESISAWNRRKHGQPGSSVSQELSRRPDTISKRLSDISEKARKSLDDMKKQTFEQQFDQNGDQVSSQSDFNFRKISRQERERNQNTKSSEKLLAAQAMAFRPKDISFQSKYQYALQERVPQSPRQKAVTVNPRDQTEEEWPSDPEDEIIYDFSGKGYESEVAQDNDYETESEIDEPGHRKPNSQHDKQRITPPSEPKKQQVSQGRKEQGQKPPIPIKPENIPPPRLPKLNEWRKVTARFIQNEDEGRSSEDYFPPPRKQQLTQEPLIVAQKAPVPLKPEVIKVERLNIEMRAQTAFLQLQSCSKRLQRMLSKTQVLQSQDIALQTQLQLPQFEGASGYDMEKILLEDEQVIDRDSDNDGYSSDELQGQFYSEDQLLPGSQVDNDDVFWAARSRSQAEQYQPLNHHIEKGLLLPKISGFSNDEESYFARRVETMEDERPKMRRSMSQIDRPDSDSEDFDIVNNFLNSLRMPQEAEQAEKRKSEAKAKFHKLSIPSMRYPLHHIHHSESSPLVSALLLPERMSKGSEITNKERSKFALDLANADKHKKKKSKSKGSDEYADKAQIIQKRSESFEDLFKKFNQKKKPHKRDIGVGQQSVRKGKKKAPKENKETNEISIQTDPYFSKEEVVSPVRGQGKQIEIQTDHSLEQLEKWGQMLKKKPGKVIQTQTSDTEQAPVNSMFEQETETQTKPRRKLERELSIEEFNRRFNNIESKVNQPMEPLSLKEYENPGAAKELFASLKKIEKKLMAAESFTVPKVQQQMADQVFYQQVAQTVEKLIQNDDNRQGGRAHDHQKRSQEKIIEERINAARAKQEKQIEKVIQNTVRKQLKEHARQERKARSAGSLKEQMEHQQLIDELVEQKLAEKMVDMVTRLEMQQEILAAKKSPQEPKNSKELQQWRERQTKELKRIRRQNRERVRRIKQIERGPENSGRPQEEQSRVRGRSDRRHRGSSRHRSSRRQVDNIQYEPVYPMHGEVRYQIQHHYIPTPSGQYARYSINVPYVIHSVFATPTPVAYPRSRASYTGRATSQVEMNSEPFGVPVIVNPSVGHHHVQQYIQNPAPYLSSSSHFTLVHSPTQESFSLPHSQFIQPSVSQFNHNTVTYQLPQATIYQPNYGSPSRFFYAGEQPHRTDNSGNEN